MFGKKWEYGQARIVACQLHQTISPRAGRLLYDFVADITPDSGGAPFRATFTTAFDFVEDYDVIPSVGEDVRARFRPGGEHPNLDPDALNARAQAVKDAATQGFADAAAGAPGTPPPGAPPQVARSGPAVVRLTTSTDPADIQRMRERLTAARAAATPAPAAADPTAKLRELAELHASGVLSDAEFASAKARILAEL
jgi:hypothetical protein